MSPKHKKTTFAMSRRRRAAILVLCLLLSAILVWFDHSPLRQKWQQHKTTEQFNSSDFEKYHRKVFTVIKVVDGDTIDIDIPDGEHNRTRIRLWGVDTPETKNERTGVMYFGPEAAEFTEKLALGKEVTVYLEEHPLPRLASRDAEASRTRDKYGRLLAYVKLPEGKFLNEVLLEKGFAYADLRFRHSLYHKYKQLEAAARSQKKGLWENVTREQLPEWLQRIRPKLLKKRNS